MSVTVVIPARLQSTRLPRKVLADIHGKPLLWHVWNRVRQAEQIDDVYIATDAEEVYAAVMGWGGQALMTSPDCRSGTERLAQCLDRLDADYIINVQGDEPLIDPAMLDALVQRWQKAPADLITPVFRIHELAEVLNPNLVKVVRAANGEALYFSRSPIPFVRDQPQAAWLDHADFWGHIGLYGYRRDVLATYPKLPISPLETIEKLEQLRFLSAGYRFQTVETDYRPVAVDVPDDLESVRILMAE